MATINTLEKKIDLIGTTMKGLVSRIDDLDTKFDGLESKMESGFKKLHEDLSEDIDSLAISTANNFGQVFEKFDEMDNRFDRIENISIGGHERRIENVEDDIRLIKTKVNLKRR